MRDNLIDGGSYQSTARMEWIREDDARGDADAPWCLPLQRNKHIRLCARIILLVISLIICIWSLYRVSVHTPVVDLDATWLQNIDRIFLDVSYIIVAGFALSNMMDGWCIYRCVPELEPIADV